jgi:DNA-binding GntR family transcriptional regulator
MKAVSATDAPPADVAVDRKVLLNETLRRRITGMELAPGAVLDEVGLAEEFGLSRPPVRELMRQLAAEGYIELEANRPARVAAMSYQSMRSFFLAAPLIYVATTQLAAQHATAQEIAELKLIQAQFRTAIEQNDVVGRVHFNDQFHRFLEEMQFWASAQAPAWWLLAAPPACCTTPCRATPPPCTASMRCRPTTRRRAGFTPAACAPPSRR